MTRFDVRGSIFDSSEFRPIEESLDYEGSSSDELTSLMPHVPQVSLASNKQDSSSSDSNLNWLQFAGLFFSSGGYGPQGLRPQGYGSGGSGFGGQPGLGTPTGSSGSGGDGSPTPLGYGGGGGGGGAAGYGGNSSPIVSSKNLRVVEDEVLPGWKVLKAYDTDGVVTHFRFRDSLGGGWFELDGKKLTEGKWHQIAYAKRNDLVYHAAENLNNKNFFFNDAVSIKARDNDKAWSARKDINIRSINNANAPIVYTTDAEISTPDTIKISSLFSVRDEDNNTIKKYRISDRTYAGSSGYLTYKGNEIAAGKWITVNAENLQDLVFHSADSSTSDKIRIGAFDGQFWGYRNVEVTTIGRPNIETDGRVILDQLQERSIFNMISQTDAGPRARIYQFFDSNTNPLSASVVDGITPYQAGQVHTVTAEEFEDLMLKGGTYDDRSFDDFYVRFNNGKQWSDWDKLTARTEPHYLQSLQRPGWNEFISLQPGQPLVVTFSFMQKTPDYYPNGPERVNFRELNDEMREGARRALSYWQQVFNITFVEVPETVGGVIRFGTADLGDPGSPAAWAYLPGSSSPINEGLPGDVWLNNSGYPDSGIPGFISWSFHSNQTEGDGGFLVMLHELGHALGLKHPFDVGTTVPKLPPATDHEGFTVMSYSGNPTFINDVGAREKYASSAMLYDIAAMEAIYGAQPVHNAGDTVYMYDNGIDDAVLKTIYDTGGIDTLDTSNQNARVAIDLAPGGFSDIGLFQRATIIFGSLVDVTTRARQNVGIAFNTWIENAVGTRFNDIIRGNDIDNDLRGGNGNDVLNGLGGNDLLSGENGNDTYQVKFANGNDTIMDNGDGTDVLEIHSHIAGSLGLNNFTDDLSFSKSGSDFFVHLSLNGGADSQGMVTIRGGAGNRIETLRLMDFQGNQFGSDIDLVSIRGSATNTPTQFKLTAASSVYGQIAAPV